MNKIIDFLKDVRVELGRVSWPTRRQTVQYTLVVIAVSLAFAVVLGLFDAGFGFLLNLLLSR